MDKQRDKAMMTNYNAWRHWPLLPIKRPSNLPSRPPQCGVMIEGHYNTVFLANLWDDNKVDAEQLVYDSLDALLEDGWVVD